VRCGMTIRKARAKAFTQRALRKNEKVAE